MRLAAGIIVVLRSGSRASVETRGMVLDKDEHMDSTRPHTMPSIIASGGASGVDINLGFSFSHMGFVGSRGSTLWGLLSRP